MMRSVLVPLAVLAAIPFALAADTKPDFSGEWKLNVDKSNFGPMPPPESETRTITHADPSLNVKSVRTGGTGDMSTEMKFTTDGKESVNKIETPGGAIEIKTTMSWEGKALIAKSKLEVQGMDINSEDHWELSEDGKTLTVNQKVTTPQGDFEASQVFDKAATAPAKSQ
jgi:hypothetical protein